MGNLTDFYLAAHSYGGYIFGTYAAKYPQHIKKLLLLSPLGTKPAPENYSYEDMRVLKNISLPWWVGGIAKVFWGKLSPQLLLRVLSEQNLKEGLDKYLEKECQFSNEEEK